ncbi:hypothetical protein EYV94_18695 [Puteibacter caeruleilacunae]|nr:hypothetical protein EYV94_18695 [Puteibacter caeruleilacunae]
MNFIKVLLIVALSFVVWHSGSAREVTILSFEKASPDKSWESDGSSTLTTTSKRFFHGNQSLKWEWNGSSFLQWNGDIGYIPSAEKTDSKAIASFSFWIYNEKPSTDSIRVSFAKDGKEASYFYYHLNFKGWRTGWVAYERDMLGTPVKGMNSVKFETPASINKGHFYIDQVIPCTFIDPRHHMADNQVPQVNPNVMQAANKHWLGLHHFSLQHADIPLKNVVSPQYVKDFKTILDRYEATFLQGVKNDKDVMAKAKKIYRKYEIKEKDGEYIGKQVLSAHYFAIYGEHIERDRIRTGPLNYIKLKDFTADFIFLARSYRKSNSEKERKILARYFVNMYRNMHYWGWAQGSGLGTVHHLGYSMRPYYPAMLLMKDVLKAEGLLNQAQQAMYWFSGNGKTHQPLETVSGINVDILNTTIHGQLASILMMDDSPEKLYEFETFARWFNHGTKLAPGLKAPFKADGSIYHHYNQYSLYGCGALDGVSPVVYWLSKTAFSLGQSGQENVCRSLRMMRLYANHTIFPVSMTGRHPYGNHATVILPFYYLAMSGSPDGKEDIDQEMAGAFLRLAKTNATKYKQEISELESKGCKAETFPQGNWSMNYGCCSLHRKDNMFLSVKGFSRYLWGSEIYIGANYYGRYISYGNLQVIDSGSNDDSAISGYNYEGWDWNRWPGTTTIHLPIDSLKNNVLQVDHMSGHEELTLSDESFAGGLSLEGMYGMFSMRLRETDKYNGSHRANKSVFMFGDHVIAIGSDIYNDVVNYKTETTVFQANRREGHQVINLNGTTHDKLGYAQQLDSEQSNWALDGYSLGYYVPAGQKAMLEIKAQESRHPKTCAKTTGDFSTLVLQHGRAPKGDAYEYAMVLHADEAKMKAFTAQQDKGEVYRVIRRDNQVHGLEYKPLNIRGYAIYDPSVLINDKLLKTVNIPVMTMIKENDDNSVTLSVCDPDLRFYEGIDHDQIDENGKQVEVSIYSRPWAGTESQPSMVTLRLNGRWDVVGGARAEKVMHFNDQTTIIVKCQHAMSKEFQLKRQ